jgi:hypothetical protein
MAGILSGGILLLHLPLKWEVAALACLGIASLSLITWNPKGVLLFVLAFTVPFYFVVKHLSERQVYVSQSTGVGLRLPDALAAVLLFLFLARWARGQARFRVFPRVTVPAFIWLVLSGVSLLVARDQQLAGFQLINMLKLLLLYWVVALSVENDGDLRFVVTGILLSLLLQAALGIFQGATGHALGLEVLGEEAAVPQQHLGGTLANRVQGTLLHPNSYAMYLTTVIPFALALLVCRVGTYLKALAALGLSLGVLALVYSLSRSAWLSFLAIICLTLMLAVRRKRMSMQTVALVGGVSCLVSLIVILFGSDMILSRLTTSDQGSALSRIALAQTALAIIRGHPWLGVGLNNYTIVLPQYSPIIFASWPMTVHNAYLLIMAETGVIGLAGFLTLLAALLFQSLQLSSRASGDLSWAAGVGVLCAFMAMALHSMVDYALLGNILLTTQFWFLAGLASALSQRSSHQQKDSGRALSAVSSATMA